MPPPPSCRVCGQQAINEEFARLAGWVFSETPTALKCICPTCHTQRMNDMRAIVESL